MKRLILTTAFLIICAATFGQIKTFYHFTSDNYRVSSDLSEAHAKTIADKMEASLVLFNEMLHFDLPELDVKLKVTMFSEKAGFNDYLTTILNQTRDNFAYIHYTDLAKSELVGFDMENEDDFNSSLIHQGFIQFLKAFIPNPPIWLREGIATYCEKAWYDIKTNKFSFRPNYIWLSTLKNIITGDKGSEGEGEDEGSLAAEEEAGTEGEDEAVAISAAEGEADEETGENADEDADIEEEDSEKIVEGVTDSISVFDLLVMNRDSVRNQLDIFYPKAWGLITFLVNSEKKHYNRAIWDSITALNPESSLRENSAAVKKNAFNWLDETTLEQDYAVFIQMLKSFNELITEGIDYYSQNELDPANEAFTKAIALEPESFIPYYYLGLVNYSNKNFQQAEQNYEKALVLGADTALTNYALGVNAFANNLYDAAKIYLSEAKNMNPENYEEKVDSLIQRIETLQ